MKSRGTFGDTPSGNFEEMPGGGIIRMAVFIFLLFFPLAIYAQTQAQAVVISKTAQLREQPSKTAKVISTVKKGTKFWLESSTHRNGWYYVSPLGENTKGWIHGNDIKIVEIELPDLSDLAIKENKWIYLFSDKITTDYYNPAKVQDLGNNIAGFWLKTIIIDKKKYWNNFNFAPTEKARSGEDLSYIMTFYKANCATKTLSVQAVFTYTMRGEIAWSVQDAQPFQLVVPDSQGEAMLDAICVYAK